MLFSIPGSITAEHAVAALAGIVITLFGALIYSIIKGKRLSQNLQSVDTESKYIFDRISDGLIVLDSNFRYVYANKKIKEITGRDPESLIGKNVWHEFPGAIGSQTYRAFNQAFTEQRYVYNLDYFEPLNLWQENHIYPSPEGLTIFIRDVSGQKRAEVELVHSEQKYRSMFELNPLPMWVLDSDSLQFLAVNKAAVNHYGYSREEFLSMNALQIRPEEEYERFKELSRPADDAPRTTGIWKHLKKDGTVIFSEVSVCHIQFEDRKARLVLANDVTERVEAEQRILELNASLEEKVKDRTAELTLLNSELETFSYTVTHDLKAPLRALSGFSKIVLQDYGQKLDDDGSRLLKEMVKIAGQMDTLIQEILQFSKLGQSELDKQDVNMDDLVHSVVAEVKAGNPHCKAEFRLNNLATASGDGGMLRMVWQNLISNAFKYSANKEKPVVEVGTLNGPEGRIYYVKDNGAGFDMQYATKLFSVFHRLHTTSEFEGSGVGLATVHRIIAKHGGTIWAEAKVNEGATFYFTLPK
ncbi:MAG: PAS domain S-box protein [Chitinophagales bacterium]